MQSSAFLLRIVAVAFAVSLGTAVATGGGIASASPSSADGSSSAGTSSGDASSSDTSSAGSSNSRSKAADSSTATEPNPESTDNSTNDVNSDIGQPDSEGNATAGVADDDSEVEDSAESRTSRRSTAKVSEHDEPRGMARTVAPRKTAKADPDVASKSTPPRDKPASQSDRDAATDTANQTDADITTASSPTTALMTRTAEVSMTRTAEVAEPQVSTEMTPVGFASRIVTGVLGMFGLTSSASDGPVAPAEPPLTWALLAFARRDIGSATLVNQLPTATLGQTSQTAEGVVTGTVGAVDTDPLTYRVSDGPDRGTVIVNDDGTYTYTPNPDLTAAGGTDTFTVVVDDNVRSLIHVSGNGLFGLHPELIGGTGRISVPITVTIAPRVSVATATAGAGASAVALSPDGKRAYVTNADGNSVSVIDTATNTTAATIKDVGNFPVAIALSPNGRSVYIANAFGDSVSVIDTGTNTVTASIAVGRTPSAIAVSPDGGRLYVTNDNGDSVSLIDTATNTVTTTIAVGANPQAVAITPNGARAYVANAGGDSVSVINTATNRVVNTIRLGPGSSPGAIAISPDGRRAYVAGFEDGTVTVIDTFSKRVVATVAVGSDPGAVAVSPNGARVYVANTGGDTVSVIETATNTMIGALPVGAGPDGLAVSPDGSLVYVPNFDTGTVSVISTAVGLATAPPSVGAATYTRGFSVYNLTQHPVTFTGYTRGDPQDIASAPRIGTVIQPGSAVRFEVVFSFFHDNVVDANFSSLNGVQYKATMEVQGVFGQGLATCSASGSASCSPSFERPTEQVFLFDPAGTVVDIGAGEGQKQAEVLNQLCRDGSLATCSFKAKLPEQEVYSEYRPVGASITNNSDIPRELRISETEAVSQSDSIQIAKKVGLKVGDIVNIEIQTTLGRTWTSTKTFGYSAVTPVPPHTKTYFVAADPMLRVYGDFTLTAGNTTWILRDVYFDTPDGSRIPDLKPVDEPLGVSP